MWSAFVQHRFRAVVYRTAAAAVALNLAIVLGLACIETPAAAQGAPVPLLLHATVTGDPATATFVGAQIDAAIARAFAPTLLPGSVARAATIMPAPQPLGRGFLTSFAVIVSIDLASGSQPVAGTTTVEVQNDDLTGFAPATLSFRDDPERITADGVLSRTIVDTRHPTRLYYYHQNVRERRRFCVVLSANDSVTTRVQTVAAGAGPNVDVMSVGHAVSKTFLDRKPRNEGTVVEIAGGKPVLQRDTTVGPGDGIVGSVDLQVLVGGPVTLTVMAIPIGAEPAAYLYTPKLPDDGHARHGTFDLTGYAQWVVAYSAGGPDAAYVYGRRQRAPANIDPTDPGRDYGDYGVMQRVGFDLNNPTDAPVTLYLYEKPLGGVVRSSFLINGSLIEVGCVRVPQRYTVTSYALDARASATIDVLTMTDGGSNYPLEIGFTETPSLAQTPPIAAADGCFPKNAAGHP